MTVTAHVKGEVVEGLRVDLAALVVRMSALEASLHKSVYTVYVTCLYESRTQNLIIVTDS